MADSGHTRQPSTGEPSQPSGPNVELQAALDVAEEDDFGDLDLESEMGASVFTSLRSSVRDHDFEHGRRYHHFRNGRYPLPNDDDEQMRDNLKHMMHLESCDGKLFNAPIGDYPQRILDLCTGTGQWPIDIADRFPSAEVIGLDLSPIQPSWVAPNLRFIVDDVEDTWVGLSGFDFIHMRHSCGYISNVDKLLRNCYENIKPGGWIEFTDFGGYPLCDDGSMPDDYPLTQCFAFIREVLSSKGCNFAIANEHEEYFKRAGFENVQCKVIKTPIGTWPKDKKQRLVGLYCREVLMGLVTGMAVKPFRQAGMRHAELDDYMHRIRQSLANNKVHSYLNFISWWGQKPMS